MKDNIYILVDKYESDMVICGLKFNENESITYKDIQNAIDDIKEDLTEINGEWQYDEILDELHTIYDFEEIEFNYNVLKV